MASTAPIKNGELLTGRDKKLTSDKFANGGAIPP